MSRRTLALAAATVLAAAAAPAQAGSFTVHSGMHCAAEGRFGRPINGALMNDSVGNTTKLFHCPIHRRDPLLPAATLTVTLNVVRNASQVTWDCALRAVNPTGGVFHSVAFIVPPWSSGAKTASVTSASLNLQGLPLPVHSVSLRCNVPDVYGNESAGIVSYSVLELD